MSEDRDSENKGRTTLPPKKTPETTGPSALGAGKPLPTESSSPFVGRPIDEVAVPAEAAETAEAIPEESEQEPESLNEAINKRRRPTFLTNLKSLPSRRVPFYKAFLGLLIPMFLIGWLCFSLGEWSGEDQAEAAATKEGLQLPPDVSAQLDHALIALRDGDSRKAIHELEEVEAAPLAYPSVTYLVALAAMQDGNIKLSEKKVEESIAKRERVSDALALQAVLETQKAHDPTYFKVGNPRQRAETLLRQAIMADAANPYPHFELATLLRYRGEKEEALREIKAAEARLNPVDSHLIMGITMAIMELENTPDSQLPTASPDSDDIRKLFPEAYASMRRGDFVTAAALLRKCRKLSSPDIFDYAVNDPAIRKFAHQPELAEFYQAAQ